MLESQIDQQERRETLRNDLKVRQEQEERRGVFAPNQSLPRQSSTLHQHAIADADTPRGRFSAVAAATVIGSTPTPATAYPAASAHQRDPVPAEPSLGYAIDAMPDLEPSALSSCSAEQPGPTSVDAPSPLAGQRTDVGPFSDQGDPTPGSAFPSGPARMARDVGSPHTFRRF